MIFVQSQNLGQARWVAELVDLDSVLDCVVVLVVVFVALLAGTVTTVVSVTVTTRAVELLRGADVGTTMTRVVPLDTNV